MLGALVQVQTGHGIAADGILGQHALDSQLHSIVGALVHHDASLGFLQTADPAGYTVVGLLIQLVAGQDSFVSVDDDDIITAVNVGGEVDLVLAAQQVSHGDGGTAQGLTGSVDDVLLAFQGLLFQKSSGHYGFLQLVKYFDKQTYIQYNVFKSLDSYITDKKECQRLFCTFL